jgi:hypothetical protein
MKEREVQDANSLKWKCVQAFSGVNGSMAQKAEELAENENGEVEVICTPSGGEQTVRISLTPDWHEKLSDDELVEQINSAKS